MKKKHYLMLFSLLLALSTYSASANTLQTSNGYIDTTKKVLPKNNQGYKPANVQEADSQKAQKAKKESDSKAKAKKAFDKDKTATNAYQSATYVDGVLAKKDASTEELKKAEEEVKKVKQFIADNKKYESTEEFKGMKETSARWDEVYADKTEEAAEREYLDNYLETAKSANDPSDMSKLTSYLSVSGGLFGLGEVFPGAVNAMVQGIFFIVKCIYILTIIILKQIFSQTFYDNLDAMVQSSATVFNLFMTDYQYLFYGIALAAGIFEMVRYRRFPFGAFKFILVWLIALFLYSPSSLSSQFGNSEITANYNLSRLVKITDGIGTEISASMITGINTLDGDSQNQSLGNSNASEEAWQAVRDSIFNDMVYDPFIALNFKKPSKGQDAVSEETVKDLIGTDGDSSKLKGVLDNNKKITRLAWNDIGSKFLIAIGALIKAIVLSLALIGIGLISIVFKYLVSFLIIFSPLILFAVMFLLNFQILANFFKKLIQFSFMSSLALAVIRAFLYINSLILSLVSAITGFYFWQAILQGLIWLIIWWFRGSIGAIFVKGTLSARELAQRAQTGLDRTFSPSVLSPLSSSNSSRILSHRMATANGKPDVNLDVKPKERKPSKVGLLAKAGRGSVRRGRDGLMTAYDRLRHDGDHELGIEKRRQFRERLSDMTAGVRYGLSKPMAYGLRSKLHDLAGDEDMPVQQKHRQREEQRFIRQQDREQKREQRSIEREEFKKFRDRMSHLPSVRHLGKHELKEAYRSYGSKEKTETKTFEGMPWVQPSPTESFSKRQRFRRHRS